MDIHLNKYRLLNIYSYLYISSYKKMYIYIYEILDLDTNLYTEKMFVNFMNIHNIYRYLIRIFKTRRYLNQIYMYIYVYK